MPASVPPRVSNDGSRRIGDQNPQQIAESIEVDFRVLIDKLDRHIELLSGTNSEVLSHLARARSICERGLCLGERLSKDGRKIVPNSD